MSDHYFTIGEHNIYITFTPSDINDEKMIPSFEPFRTEELRGELLFHLTVDDKLQPIDKALLQHIRTFDSGNGDIIVDLVNNGGYQYILKDCKGYSCCLLQTNKDFTECTCALNGNYDMRHFGLNNALMLVYAFRSSYKDTLLIHASLVRHEGYGYPFTAKSGTGKSTHVNLWLQHIPHCDMMNDDNPIIRIIDDKAFIYGSPWSGKTPCYRNTKAPLGALTHIERAKANSVVREKPVTAFGLLIPACSTMKWDTVIFKNTCDTIIKLIERVPIYTLHCLPDQAAAQLCHDTITID